MASRGPGWPTVLVLAAVTLAFSVVHPLMLMAIPLAALLVALPPRRPLALAVGVALLVVAFTGPRGELWYVERGWALLLGCWFALASLLWPARAFVTRALAATGATALTGGVIVVLTDGWAALDWTIATRYRESAEAMAAIWPESLGDPGEVIDRAATLPAEIFPAMLAVASVTALAVAWWGFRRIGQDGPSLGRLPEFRFPDPLVWVLIAGIALLVVPAADPVERLGANLVFFMSALYVVRGLAVVVALVGSQTAALVMLGLVALVLYPIVMAGTLLVGLTDTWLDLRAGRRAVNEEG